MGRLCGAGVMWRGSTLNQEKGDPSSNAAIHEDSDHTLVTWCPCKHAPTWPWARRVGVRITWELRVHYGGTSPRSDFPLSSVWDLEQKKRAGCFFKKLGCPFFLRHGGRAPLFHGPLERSCCSTVTQGWREGRARKKDRILLKVNDKLVSPGSRWSFLSSSLPSKKNWGENYCRKHST